MIHTYQTFELASKNVVEHIRFTPPFRAQELFDNEACLIYAVDGEAELLSPTSKLVFANGESVLMKCGNYVNKWQARTTDEPTEAIAIHLYPEVLDVVYNGSLPDFLKSDSVGKGTVVKIEKDEVMSAFMKSLSPYFATPELFTKEILCLKVREFIALLYNMNSNGIRELLADLFNPETIEFKEIVRNHL